MDCKLQKDDKITIKKISIEGIGIKDLLKPEFLDKLNSKFNEVSLINLALTVEEDIPSNLISLGHSSSKDFKDNVLTISVENEEFLVKILDVL